MFLLLASVVISASANVISVVELESIVLYVARISVSSGVKILMALRESPLINSLDKEGLRAL